jgi:PAS domain S-box-containing protein
MKALLDADVFRLAVDSTPAGVLVYDPTGTIVYANRGIEAIFGHAPSELAGRSVHDLLPEASPRDDGAGPDAPPQRPDSTPGAARRVLTGRRRNGSEVSVEVVQTVTGDPRNTLIIASILDLTDRLGLEHRLTDTLREHASFEHLVSDVAATFVSLGSDQIDEAIVDSLERIAESLSVDRSSWWDVVPDSSDAVITHTWTRPEYRVMPHGESAAIQVPALLARLRKGEIVAIPRVEDLPPADREGMRRYGGKSGAAVPFIAGGQLRGILGFTAIRAFRDWPTEVIDRLRLLAAIFGQAVMRRESDMRLRDALAELEQLRDELVVENVQLRREVKMLGGHRALVAESPAARFALEQVEMVAATDATVLLLGETGAGKEIFAQAIHRLSERRAKTMVAVNCSALPATLIESELFGRERGAYTGALARQIGRFEMAHQSTIFLDEIAELPLDAQVKLLRVLQDKVIERLGGGQPISVNVRIIAATNRNLEKAVADRTFREDLFYRLNVFPITVPPLRERTADIPALVWAFIDEFATAFRKPIESISKDSLAALRAYHWPGNVRELRNVIERAVIVAKTPRLVVSLPAITGGTTRASTRLADIEVEQITRVLESVGWRVRGPGGAAELLGLKPNTLDSRMAKLGIRRPGSSPRA